MSKKPPSKTTAKAGVKRVAAKKPLKIREINDIRKGIHVMYGVIIHDAIARGNVTELRNLLDAAKTQHAANQSALKELERAIRKSSAS